MVAAAASALLEATGRIDELDGKVRRCRWRLQERRGGGGDSGEDSKLGRCRGRQGWVRGCKAGRAEGVQGGG